MKHKILLSIVIVLSSFLIIGINTAYCNPDSNITLLEGQSVYVPVYSHIYHGDREKQFSLTATLSIRNTDPNQKISIVSVDYFDSNGNFLKNYVKQPINLEIFASIRYVVKSKDKTGGSGAKFIVRWKSMKPVNPPIIEAIMISTQSTQGISFTSRGQSIKE